MPSFLRRISRILLMVMLATVFSPSFGWEIVEGVAPHDHAVSTLESVADSAVDCHGHHAETATAHEGDHAASSSDLSHHCCPGHVLGHLLGGLGADAQPVLFSGRDQSVSPEHVRFSSRVPEGFERPPRFAA